MGRRDDEAQHEGIEGIEGNEGARRPAIRFLSRLPFLPEDGVQHEGHEVHPSPSRPARCPPDTGYGWSLNGGPRRTRDGCRFCRQLEVRRSRPRVAGARDGQAEAPFALEPTEMAVGQLPFLPGSDLCPDRVADSAALGELTPDLFPTRRGVQYLQPRRGCRLPILPKIGDCRKPSCGCRFCRKSKLGWYWVVQVRCAAVRGGQG